MIKYEKCPYANDLKHACCKFRNEVDECFILKNTNFKKKNGERRDCPFYKDSSFYIDEITLEEFKKGGF